MLVFTDDLVSDVPGVERLVMMRGKGCLVFDRRHLSDGKCF